MQANWSLVLNVLLLVGVMVALGRMMNAKRRQREPISMDLPSVGKVDDPQTDEIIAVRKIESVDEMELGAKKPKLNTSPLEVAVISPTAQKKPSLGRPLTAPVMIFLLAKDHRYFVGYELLQTVLAAGLRFGEGQLFHRHQSPHGQGPILCSLASATATGTFDLQNIGAFRVHGLCLFMDASGNPTIDAERFAIMLDTAKQLSEGLDAHLLDDERQPLSDGSIARYHRILKLQEGQKVSTPDEVCEHP